VKDNPTQTNPNIFSSPISGLKLSLTMQISYEKYLNPSQLEAVNYDRGPLLVIAGAGSGKTRTLTFRVARLVASGIQPEEILLLTFTRKAAHEMLKRATQLLDERCDRVGGGTFHGFANAVIRRYGDRLGFNAAFTILDRADAEGLIAMLRKQMHPLSSCRAFPKKQTLANIFSRSVNKVAPLEEVVLADYSHFNEHIDDIIAIRNAYTLHKREQNLLDYDDLLIHLQTLLREYSEIRQKLSDRYRYIMVDEYQDTNQIQAEIIYLLGQAHRNVMVVGDDSQSIYAFRGANFKNIMEFPKRFPEAKIVKLEENYRSVQPILTLTNQMIDRAREKYAKKLFTRRCGGNVPVLVDTVSETDQSLFVVQKIQELRGQGISLDDIAVLFRAGFHSFDLEIELNREGVPFIKVGGFKFMESAHIKDVLAHLKIVANPYDSMSWQRILLLVDKIGTKTAQRLYQAVFKQQAGYAGIFSATCQTGRNKGIERLKDLYALIDSKPMGVAQMGEAVLNYYQPILAGKYDDYPKRMKDLEHLMAIMARYDRLDAFLADMALEPPSASRNNRLSVINRDRHCLTLSTVHSAKGLEWHTVFVIWALDGRFPSIHALKNEEDLEEELRLLYVAATRARENLYFSYPMQVYDRTSGVMLSRPSRFLETIPEDVLVRETIGVL
jgi:DNA helicase II / ATP-dependent DNA helicase PcrA